MTPVMGGSGTSPKACMQMTWKACPAGRRCTGTVHMLTASAHPVPASRRYPICHTLAQMRKSGALQFNPQWLL